MAMKVLVARRFLDGSVRVQIHLDTTKLLPDSTPDPAWCHERTWRVPPQRATETPAAYGARISAWMTATRPEFVAECTARLAELQSAADAGVALSIEGVTF